MIREYRMSWGAKPNLVLFFSHQNQFKWAALRARSLCETVDPSENAIASEPQLIETIHLQLEPSTDLTLAAASN